MLVLFPALLGLEIKANIIADYSVYDGLLNIQLTGARDWYLSDGISPPTFGTVDFGQPIPPGAVPGLVHETLVGAFTQPVENLTVTIREFNANETYFLSGVVAGFSFSAQDVLVPGLDFQSASFTLVSPAEGGSVPDGTNTLFLLLLALFAAIVWSRLAVHCGCQLKEGQRFRAQMP